MWGRQIVVAIGFALFGGVAVYSGACGSGVVLFTNEGGDGTGSSSSGSPTSTPGDPGRPPDLPPGPPSTNPMSPDADGVTPSVDCVVGGDAGDPCLVPPSPQCIDNEYLAAFGSGTCVGGKCKYTVTTYDCLATSSSNCTEINDAGSCQTVIIK